MCASDLPPFPSRFWIKKLTWNIIDLQKDNTHIDISHTHTRARNKFRVEKKSAILLKGPSPLIS